MVYIEQVSGDGAEGLIARICAAARVRAGGIAAQVIAYFNCINRIADGLGVDDETWMDLSREEWHRKRGRDWFAPDVARHEGDVSR